MKLELNKKQNAHKNAYQKNRLTTLISKLWTAMINTGIYRLYLALFLSALVLSTIGFLLPQDSSVRVYFLNSGALFIGIWLGCTLAKYKKKSYLFTLIMIPVYFLSFFGALFSLNNLLQTSILQQPFNFSAFTGNIVIFILCLAFLLDLIYRLLKFVFQKIRSFLYKHLEDNPSKTMIIFNNLISTLLTIATLLSTIFSLSGLISNII